MGTASDESLEAIIVTDTGGSQVICKRGDPGPVRGKGGMSC